MPNPAELENQGFTALKAEDYDAAVTAFAQAAAIYANAQNAVAVAEMRNNQAVAHLARQDYAAALAAVMGTPEVFHAAGETLSEAKACSTLGDSFAKLKRLPEAVTHYEHAIALLTALGERPLRAACWADLAGVLAQQRKIPQAIAAMRASLELRPAPSPVEMWLNATGDTGLGVLRHA